GRSRLVGAGNPPRSRIDRTCERALPCGRSHQLPVAPPPPDAPPPKPPNPPPPPPPPNPPMPPPIHGPPRPPPYHGPPQPPQGRRPRRVVRDSVTRKKTAKATNGSQVTDVTRADGLRRGGCTSAGTGARSPFESAMAAAACDSPARMPPAKSPPRK